jgi:lipopolysaccharide biosynthesis protein
MRLAIYAHYADHSEVARHVVYYLERLRELKFDICFVSNSVLSPASEAGLRKLCDRVIVRKNTGFDFCMWQRGMAEYDLLQYEELLLTNSSIIGPLQPLAVLWQNPELGDCDFWGLTDNDDLKLHLSSYFLVFRQRALHSERFREFWRAVLPFKSKWQIVFSYELGLSEWMEAGGFTWRAAFPIKQMLKTHRSQCGFWGMCRDRALILKYLYRNREWPPQNTTLVYPEVLLECGMPFLKASLLHQKSMRISPAAAFSLLEKFRLPKDILVELRQRYSGG